MRRMAWHETCWLAGTAYAAAFAEGAKIWQSGVKVQRWCLAAAEAELGIGGFLSLGPELRFESHGRNFRITDTGNLEREEVPDEIDAVPGPDETPGQRQPQPYSHGQGEILKLQFLDSR